jgi:hypothetical protein
MDSAAPIVNLADQTTAAIVIVVGVGLALQGFVFAAVTIMRGMIGRARHRRVILPLAGIASGCVFALMVFAFMEVGWSLKTVSLVFMAGFWAYVISAGLHSQGKEVRRG